MVRVRVEEEAAREALRAKEEEEEERRKAGHLEEAPGLSASEPCPDAQEASSTRAAAPVSGAAAHVHETPALRLLAGGRPGPSQSP